MRKFVMKKKSVQKNVIFSLSLWLIRDANGAIQIFLFLDKLSMCVVDERR